jgi:hypothetical protein
VKIPHKEFNAAVRDGAVGRKVGRIREGSNVDSTFSMPKAKFRDHVCSRTDTAMKNQVLFKMLCHNIVVVHQAIIELGIEATFWPGDCIAPFAILPLVRRG